MNEIHRRTALSALGLAGIAAAAKAGPLNPPAGAVVSSGRTLDEVYNKIPTPPAIGGYDGRIPIPGGTTAVTIGQPGSYVLTGDLVDSIVPLKVLADNVTIDLNGFTVTCSSTTGQAFRASSVNNLRLRNGRVVGGQVGIQFSGENNNCIVEDVYCTDAYNIGIYTNSNFNRGIILRRCTVSDVGSSTTSADGNMVMQGIYVLGNACRIEGCTVSRMRYNGSGTVLYRGIYIDGSTTTSLTTGNCVSNCTISQEVASSGTGLSVLGISIYRNNTVLHYATAYNASAAVNGGGNVSA